MTPERWAQIRQVFEAVIERPVSLRRAFLDQVAAKDSDLKQEVLSLLETHERATEFLESPVAHLGSLAGTTTAQDDATVVRPVAALQASAPSTRLIGYRLGLYEFQRELGSGGMGSVWLATRSGSDFMKQVAVKMVRLASDLASSDATSKEVLRRFHTERQVLAGLDHPHIAVLIDGGSTTADPTFGIREGLPYLVMEYVEGTPIDQYCESNKLSISDRLRLFRNVCDAVHFAHQHLVIHRDIKAANILVTRDGVPKLLDFGIAKLLSAGGVDLNQTRADLRPMTLDYASPEQIRGEPITTATDIYSLGVLLYRMLTGKLPHSTGTETRGELQHRICEQDPIPPSEAVLANRKTAVPNATQLMEAMSETRDAARRRLRSKLQGDLDAIILKALARDPQQRYASAKGFSDDVGRYLDGLPVVARGDVPGYRFQKWLRRNWRGSAVAAALVVGLAMLAGVSLIRAGRADAQARQQAEANRQLRESLLNSESEAAEANLKLADELAQRGATDQAIVRYRTAQELYKKLLAEEPSDRDAQRALEKVEQTLASLADSVRR